MQVTIIDFDDSFTHNIAAKVYALGFVVHVMHWKNFSAEMISPRQIVIYGPGPGAPEEYLQIGPQIMCLLQRVDLFHMGICLGHQLLWTLMGYRVQKCQRPVHGQTVELNLPSWQIFAPDDWGKKMQVQRYNSLTLDVGRNPGTHFHMESGECIMGLLERGITYQFHPESVGTSCSRPFWWPLQHFGYAS